MTAAGHARAIFRRAIEHGNLLVAEAEYLPMGGYELCDAGPGGHGRRHQLLVRHASGNEPV